MIGITKRQQEVYDYICSYLKTHRMAPSLAEIGAYFHISTPTALAHVRALEQKRLINRSNKARSLTTVQEERNMAKVSAFFTVVRVRTPADIDALAHPPENAERLFADPDCLRSSDSGTLFAFVLTHNEALPQDNFEPGDIIIVSRGNMIAPQAWVLAENKGLFFLARAERTDSGWHFTRGNNRPVSGRMQNATVCGAIVSLRRRIAKTEEESR